ncbi:regulator of hemoglobinization and erythroid cell expansion protein isoform X1 [Phasianus colchicus]|uniref:regulator of hemoglobinization and erythroid cell expansion protein isoform X1 n=2 Tax=Phasianus colchicus TaxID=9054 RepID=UPI00129EF574|nr:regulator of hemoglobinization and erythroid cell expansion protein isoform X1 [Phasianus colchicus]
MSVCLSVSRNLGDVAGTTLTTEMERCEWWVPVATSAVTLLLSALLLLLLYIMLSRKIDRHCCSAPVKSGPTAQPQQPPISSAGGEGVQQPNYTEGSSETSSETSEDSDSSSLHPQERKTCSKEDLNYTSVLFPGKGRGSGSDRNYENIKIGADYVNVDPKKKKADFWTCSSPVASKSIEYTEVKL